MTNGKIPPEWVKMNSKSRPELSYYFNKTDKRAYWEHDIQFDDSGNVIFSPTACQISRPSPSQKSTKDIEDSFDDKILAMLGQNQVQVKSPNLKRKLDGSVSTCHEDSRSNHSSKNGICSRKMVPIKRTNDQKHQVDNTVTEDKSTDSGISLSSPKEELTPKNYKRKEETKAGSQKFLYKTPIQDKYDQIKCLFLKNQQESHTKTQSSVLHKELKRKSSDGQGVEASPNENNYKILKTNNSQDRGKPHSLPSADSPVHEKQVFDLRTKIQQRKFSSMGHNLQSDAPCPMDWEPSYPAAPVPTEDINSQSPPTQERHPRYTRVYLVCDTSALVRECDFVESLIVKGSYLGLPLTVVIPFVVFDELDGLKAGGTDVGYLARKISRVIQSSDADKHLYIQEGDKKREAVGSLELRCNDDLVLNCCLQMREKCGENELAILMTADINLNNKAKSFKLPSYKWQTFKKWARGMREYKIPSLLPNSSKQVSPGKMSIDEDCEDRLEKRDLNNSGNETMVLDGTVSNNQKTDSIPSLASSSQLKIIDQSHVEELITDFQTFLYNVLEEACAKLYGDLKKFSWNIKPSWTLLDYICEVKRRWFLLSGSNHPPNVERILNEIMSIFKKHNSGKEELKISDIDSLFRSCVSFSNIISKHSPQQAKRFVDTIFVSNVDWKNAFRSNESPNNTVKNGMDDVQPVDVALQQIYQCSFSDYKFLRSKFDNNQDTLEQVSAIYGKIADVLFVMKRLFDEKPDALTVDNKYALELQKIVTFFSDVKGNPMGFEIVVENVVELFQEGIYRNNAKQLIEKFGGLEKLINSMIER